MAYLGLTWIIVAVVLTGASQTAASCDSVEVKDAGISGANGIYTEQYRVTCDSSRYLYQKGQTCLYHINGYWMISEYYYCLHENDSRVMARVYDFAEWPEYITNYWEEWVHNGWYPNAYLDVDCYDENDGGLWTGPIVGISLGSIFGVVVVVGIVSSLVKLCKSSAANTQAIQPSSSTASCVSNSYSIPQRNSTSESYQPPACEPPGYINPHFESDGPDVQPTAPVYDEMPPEDVPPPPSYEEVVNNHKYLNTSHK